MEPQILYLVEKELVPQTMLFAGPESSNKRAEALELALALLKASKPSHPDLHIYVPDSTGGMHSMDAMRKFIQEVHMSPYQAAAKVFILEDADKMLPTSSNALLKTLEEPSLNCYIILLSSKADAILPTILSRTRKFTFKGEEKKKKEQTEKRDLLVRLLSQKIPYAECMKALLQFSEEENEEEVLGDLMDWYRDRHFLANGGAEENLYFNAYKKQLQECSLPLPPLEILFDQVETARFAVQQHVNLRHCLERFIRSITS